MNTLINEKWLQHDVWQRVVDGELSRAELRELASTCEQHPELWKLCAVAFLEEQTLALELRDFGANWPATPADAGHQQRSSSRGNDWLADDGACVADAACHVVEAYPPEEATPLERAIARPTIPCDQPHSPPRLCWLNHLGLAASVAIAFLVGWQASQRFGRDTQLSSLAEANQTDAVGNSSLAQQAPPSAADSSSEVASTQLPGGASAERIDVDTAWVDTTPSLEVAADAIGQALQRPEQFVPLDRRIPQQLADLERRGLVRIESIEGFVPVRLRNGNTAVVPVQQIELRPVRNAY